MTIDEVAHKRAKRHECANYARACVPSLSSVAAAAHATPFNQPGDVIADKCTIGAADAQRAAALDECS
jgi:hypothetical protein